MERLTERSLNAECQADVDIGRGNVVTGSRERLCGVILKKKSACPWIEILYQNGDGYVKSWENSVVLSKTRITEKTNNTDESRHADNAVTTKIFVRVGFTLSPRVRWTRSDDQRFTESISSDKKTTPLSPWQRGTFRFVSSDASVSLWNRQPSKGDVTMAWKSRVWLSK